MGQAGSSFNRDARYQPLSDTDTGIDYQMGQAGSSNRDAQYHDQPLNDTNISNDVKAIEYKEIVKATKKFHPNSLMGEGSDRRVYEGWIEEQKLTATKPGSGIAVAVKKMNSDDMYQEHKEWVEDINYTSQLHHPNLAKFIGYSFDKDIRFVVHEFMEKGSLDHHLFNANTQPLPWATRIKVGIGAARAFAFLNGLEEPIILGTLSTSDILLDSDFNPKFSDIGRAKRGVAYEIVHGARAIEVRRYAHVSPEYLMLGRFHQNSDVYSFGVVLLELMSGLRVIDNNRPKQKRNLIVWAKPYLRSKRKVSQVMDGRLGGDYPHEEARKVSILALQCLHPDPKLRPRMFEVVAALENL